MKFSILALDLDGTLVTKKNNVSKKNNLSLKKYISAGGMVIFVTGRSLNSASSVSRKVENTINYTVPYLCSLNGALIYDNVNKKILYESKIKAAIVEEIFKIVKKNKLGISYYSEKVLEENRMPVYGFGVFPNIISSFKGGTKIVSWDETISDAYKINVIKKFSTKKLFKVSKFIAEKFSNEIDVSITTDYVIEITPKNINKGSAIEFLSKLLDVDTKSFASMGDSGNDYEMFKKTGFNILIGKPKNKNILLLTDEHITSKQKNAVSVAIDKFII